MTIWMMFFAFLVGWNLFLHVKLSKESNQRRELAVAFRQFMIDRRRPAL